MRLVAVVAAFVVASLSTGSAQTFTAMAPVTDPLTKSTLAGVELIGPITATTGASGDALLFRVSVGWRNVVFVGRVHPAKSGPVGIYATPGLCMESAIAFAFAPDTIVAADINGDGIDDLVGTAGVEAQVLIGHGLNACR